MKPVSIVVPVWNEEENITELTAEIASVSKTNGFDYELIFVDDGSTDNSADEVEKTFPDVKIIRLKEKGFAAGARNEGILASKGDAVLFIDNDARLEEGALKNMVVGLGNSDIVFPKIAFDNGTMMYPRTKADEAYPSISAVFLMKKSALEKLDAYFDENYGIYFEDTDFFQRCKLFGLKASYAPAAVARHIVKPAGNKERQYFLYVRNYVYGWLKFFGMGSPFKGLAKFMAVKLFANGLLNYAWQERYHTTAITSGKLGLLKGHEKLTERNRLVLIPLFFRAVLWNVKNLGMTLGERRKLLASLKVTA